ncbi:MAG: S24 family peptidase [Candidatus Berkiellales bacterium]
MTESNLKTTICERLKSARYHAGFATAKEFAEKKGLKISTYNLHEAGTRSMSFAVLEHYAQLLNINTNWLLTGVEPKNRTTIRNVPIINWEEIPQFPAEVNLQNRSWTTSDMDLSPHSFALQVDNDAMEPRYPAGTVIIVDCQQKPGTKDFALLFIKEKKLITFKQLIHIDGELMAKSLNPKYPPLALSPNIKIIGKVVQAKLIC